MAEYDRLANNYRSKGITVIPCPFGGEEILDCIYKESPDVVIMDLFMPRVDTLGVLHEVSKKPLTKKITFIVLRLSIALSLIKNCMPTVLAR